jgi:putative transcriptional regulator
MGFMSKHPVLTAVLLFLAAAMPWQTGAATAAHPAPVQAGAASLAGKLLVATPKLQDPNFRHTVVYVVEHNDRGALGLVVNRTIGHGPLGKLLAGLGVAEGVDGERVIPIHEGGPVDRNRGFVLHSVDYQHDGTVILEEIAALSAPAEQLPEIALEQGTHQGLIAFGYAGWGPQQLENEIAQGSWFAIEADEALLFDDAIATKWQRALALRGFEL